MISAQEAIKKSESVDAVKQMLRYIEWAINHESKDGHRMIPINFSEYSKKDADKVKEILISEGYSLIPYGSDFDLQKITW